MGKTLEEMLNDLPKERRERIERRGVELINEYLTLQDLRKAHEFTQESLAEMLNMPQSSISRLEKRSDMLLSTLRSYVNAMGGELKLVAEFPDRDPVAISGIADIEGDISDIRKH